MKALPGSEKGPATDSRVVGDVDPEHPMIVTVVLRPKEALSPAAQAGGGEHMSREEYAARHGADENDVAKVEAFAAAHHLSVFSIQLAAGTMVLGGRTADMQTAFGVNLKMYTTEDNERFRGREGEVYVPEDLEGIVTAVFGLDDRPAADPHLRRLKIEAVSAPQIEVKVRADAQAVAAPHAFNAPAVGTLYQFPANLHGTGQTIAIIELGGGYRMSDLNAYFQSLGMATPSVVSVGVDGITNNPGVNTDADGEVALDIEVAGSIAPHARIAVYFGRNTGAGFLNAINAAIHDAVRKPSVISISWGGPEETFTVAAKQQYEAAFQAAAAIGVTVLAASGDNGSSDGVRDGKPHVDFPAAAPSVLACGGTRLLATNPTTIASETVWNDGPTGPGAGGGGVSNFFPKPAYQAAVTVPKLPNGFAGRGSPDVSGNADPITGYNVVVGGQRQVIGGTSAVAPLYAGLIALLNEAATPRKVGLIQPKLYAAPGTCHDVTQSSNDYSGLLGVYKAGPGWDAASGLGSAIGTHWVTALVAPHPVAQPAPPQPQPQPQPNP
jgi:kumamolisin